MSHSSYPRPREGRPCLHAPTSPGKMVANEQDAAHCRQLDHKVTTATAHAHTGQLLRLSLGMAPTLVQLTRVEPVQPTCNTLSGCVTQDPRVDASEASAIHPTHTNVCVWNVDTHCVRR